MSKITQAQIQKLYQFTRQHFVEHYDLQTELVDHLANDIEKIWLESPNMSFDEAKQRSFKKFGVFGFMDVVAERHKAMNKRYRSILWNHAKEWFQLPKILVSITLFLLFYYLMQFQAGRYIFLGLLFVLAVGEIIVGMRLKKRFKKRFKENKRKWVLEEMIFNIAIFNAVILVTNLFNIFNNIIERELPIILTSIIALIFTIAIVFSYVSLVVLPKKVENLLESTYPEYKIS